MCRRVTEVEVVDEATRERAVVDVLKPRFLGRVRRRVRSLAGHAVSEDVENVAWATPWVVDGSSRHAHGLAGEKRWRVWLNVPLPKANTLVGSTSNTSTGPCSCSNAPSATW